MFFIKPEKIVLKVENMYNEHKNVNVKKAIADSTKKENLPGSY
jgi:hypothetical protein